MKLRDYQEEAVAFLLPRARGFVKAPAGSGKTIIGAAAAARIVQDGWRVHVLCNTIDQVQQWHGAFSSIECGAKNVEIEVNCVAGLPDVAKADLVIVDESHHASAATWEATIERATGLVWGLSATPWTGDPERDAKLQALFVEFFEVDRERVRASGHLADARVIFHDLDRHGEFDAEIDRRSEAEIRRRCRVFPFIAKWEHERRVRHQETMKMVFENRVRNACVVSLAVAAMHAGKKVLVLVGSIEHGEEFVSALNLQRPDSTALVWSKLSKKKRRETIESLRSGSLQCMVATSLADEGLDVPIIEELILVGAGRSAAKIEQRTGRVLRPFKGKTEGVIHDFIDRGARFAYAQFKSRLKTYETLGYVIEGDLRKS